MDGQQFKEKLFTRGDKSLNLSRGKEHALVVLIYLMALVVAEVLTAYIKKEWGLIVTP